MAAVAAVDASGPDPVQLFVGAKDYQSMAKLGHELQRVVPVGDWIGPIVVALMGLLRWVQSHVGNWGWSIVVLTVLINLAMAPFRHYSIVNGLKMAKLSPEMRVIQERYRKVPLMDPKRQQMQEEIAALYAKHGMSMSSQMMVGCLPLLLTMPFLFAFYRVLSVSVELRGAPFLWISDLAQKDPLFLTPVLMGVSMFAMQKMTPSTMDPAQQRIMMLMPLMLAGMFLWAPAGLNLYWLTSNLWSVLQQGVSMKLLRPGRRAREGQEGEVKDRVFSGPDVEEAIAVAAASLGLPRAELRYVVLDPGTAGVAASGPPRRGSRSFSRSRAGRSIPHPSGRPPRPGRRTRGPASARRSAPWPRPGASTWRRRSRRPRRRWSCDSAGPTRRSSWGRRGVATCSAPPSTSCCGSTAPPCSRARCASPARASASGGTRRSWRRPAAWPPPSAPTGSRG